MAHFDLTSITTGAEPKPPRIVVYGIDGVGKTTWATSAPGPIVIPIEKGLAALRVPKFPIVRSYGDFMAALGTLYSTSHRYGTAIIDTIDWLERLVWAHTAFIGGKENIEDFGYGKGYVLATEHWNAILEGLDALNDKGMTVIAIAHAGIKRFNAPDTEPYDRYEIKLHKTAAELWREWADVVAFAHYEVNTVSTDAGFNKKVTRGVGVGRRLLSVEERPAFHAKNRYSLPAEIEMPRNNGFAAFAAACANAYARPEEPVYAASPSDNMDAPIPQNETAAQEMDDALTEVLTD